MSDLNRTWRSNGKLLLTGEYLVMEGSLSLALPIYKSQTLTVCTNNNHVINWKSNKPDGLWFDAKFSLPEIEILNTSNIKLASKLKSILIEAKMISRSFLNDNMGYSIETDLDFNPEYGFGTSSTLISNISHWANIDPYRLLTSTFGGSGYDIACARNNHPIFFRKDDMGIHVHSAEFAPTFHKNLYFVYLGKKQNSAESVTNFRKNCTYTSHDIDTISLITKEVSIAKELSEFEELLMEHELVMSRILNLETSKSLYFSGHDGAVKSLGAWGGDFVLVTSNEPEYIFRRKMQEMGFSIVFKYIDLIL